MRRAPSAASPAMRAGRALMAAAVGGLCAPGLARAEDAARAPVVVLEVRDTAEGWRNLQGGVAVGDSTLNKLQASFRFDGAAIGWRGFSAYAQVFKTNAQSLSAGRSGDVQTASNIEAPGVERLMELWVSQAFGDPDAAGSLLVRGGVVDLNRTFDSIDPAGLFLNSSHGIGPDLSHSGPSGPSIFPVGGLAAQADWRPAARLALHGGIFAEPDPQRQDRFVDAAPSRRYGAVGIVQADFAVTPEVQASLGAWRYTAAQASLADPGRRLRPRPGVYGFVQGPTRLPGAPNGWIRIGLADRRLQDVAGYLGGGLVWQGLLPGRRADSFGLAVAHAVIGGPARDAGGGLPAAETSFEATYSLALGRRIHLQPDLQHIRHPAGAPGLRSATLVGLRLSVGARVSSGE